MNGQLLQEYDCCVPGCGSNQVNNPELYFHPLPNVHRLRELWLETCNIVERDPVITNTFRVCEKHFDSAQYLQNYQLLQGALPKIIPNLTKPSDPKLNATNNTDMSTAVSPLLNMHALSKDVRDRINDNKIQKFNVSLNKSKLSHLLLILDGYKTTLNRSEIKPVAHDPVASVLNDSQSYMVDPSFSIPAEEQSNPVVLNKITSTGEEITMMIKSSKRTSRQQKSKPITYDFTQICRVCLENGDLKNIYAEFVDEISVNELLQQYTAFMMLEDSNLPPQICTKCLVNLTQVHEFFKKLDYSYTIYQNRLQSKMLDQPDLLTYKQKYFLPLETPQENITQREAPEIQEETHNVLDEAPEKTIDDNSNNSVIDLEPEQTIDEIMDTGLDDVITESIAMNADEFICLKCEESYDNFSLLSQHLCSFAPEPAAILTDYKCRFCKTMFKTYNKFSTHLCYVKRGKQATDVTQTVRKEYKCQVCGEIFMSNSLFLYHRKLYKHNVAHYCYECDVNFLTRVAYRHHKTTFQHKNDRKCDICKRFIKITKFAAHLADHSSSILCKYCGKHFINEMKYEKHLELCRCKNVAVKSPIPLSQATPNRFKLKLIKMYLNK